MKKPREFYLYTANRGMFYGLENEKTWDDDIHVIEKQAYNELKSHADKLADALDSLCLDIRTPSRLGLDKSVNPNWKALNNAEQILKQYRGDEDKGRTVCQHGDTSPMTCKLCRGDND